MAKHKMQKPKTQHELESDSSPKWKCFVWLVGFPYVFTDRFVWKCKIEMVTKAGSSRGKGQRKSEKEHESVRKCENV